MAASDTVIIDKELFDAFLEESDELLLLLDQHSTALESDLNPEYIHKIFREVHSLKGNSSFFNLTNIKTFCHSFENYLNIIRDKRLKIDDETTQLIIEGSDHLKSIFNRLSDRSAQDVELLANEIHYLRQLDERYAQTTQEQKLDALRASLVKFSATEMDGLSPDAKASASAVFDIIRGHAPYLLEDKRKGTADGSRYICGSVDVTREYLFLKDILAKAVDGATEMNSMHIFTNVIDRLIDKHTNAGDRRLANMLENIKQENEMFYQEEIGFDELLAETLSGDLEIYFQNISKISPETADIKEMSAPETTADGKQTAEPDIRKAGYLRISENLLDLFADHVGELITLSEMFNFIQKKFEADDLKDLAIIFRNSNRSFRELSLQLQKNLYEIRKVPLEKAFTKLPRLARNMARETGKKIAFKSTGGEIEIDKSLLEKLETIFVHLVRNSADHGIESPEQREKAGKAPEGIISISAKSDNQNLYINISDDGRGVDLGKVRAAALHRRLVSDGDADKLTNKELLDLTLLPGFSTAAEITETSGRGVGLDVLAAGVYELGGSLSLENNPGQGFVVKLATPIAYTTRIKLGLTLAVGSSIFLIPAENVKETFKVDQRHVSKVKGRGEIIQRFGKVYPAIRAHDMFDIEPARQNIWDAICVLVESRNATVCLIVDAVLEQRQIVYKQLTVQTKEPSAFAGVSMLDGSKIALVLDVDGIIEQNQKRIAGGA